MKWLVASDIHGSALHCRTLLRRFDEEGAERLLLLGDILYHGPRNSLPDGYSPQEVAGMLNGRRVQIACVRGNCDSEVDQMVLSFPIMADYIAVDTGRRIVYATHGHLFNEQNPLPAAEGHVLLCGHTHVPACTDCGSFMYLNPGSVSIPKGDSQRSYMIFDGKAFSWRQLDDGAEFLRWQMD